MSPTEEELIIRWIAKANEALGELLYLAQRGQNEWDKADLSTMQDDLNKLARAIADA